MAAPLSRQLPDNYSGLNLAPVKPFTKLAEKQGDKSPFSSHYITEAIRKKYEEKSKSQESARREMILAGQLVALFIEGKQLLKFNPYTNRYTITKGSRTDPSKIKAINLMQYYASNWQAKWGSSNPDIHVGPLSNDDQEVAKARKANAVVDHLERNMYDTWYNYHEGLMAQVFGWYGMRVRPCSKSGRIIQRPIVEEKEFTLGKGFGKCHDCNWAGAGPLNSIQISQTDSMPVCPKCGSTAVYYDPPPQQLMPQEVGSEPYRLPRIISEQLPFPACWWDIRYRMEDSSWFIYEQEVDENAVRRALGNIRLPAGEGTNQLGLDVIAELSAMAAPIGGRSDSGYSKTDGQKTTVTEMYLSCDEMWDIKIEGDEETFAGINLPVGSRLGEFVQGLGVEEACFTGVNGYALLTGIWLENHQDTHTSGVYHMKPMSGTGRGVGDAVELQKRFNKLDSQAVRHMQSQATPATLHVEGAIPQSHRHLLGQPDVDIPVSIQNFPEINDIRKLVAPLQGNAVSGDLLQYTYQHLNNFMQLAYHITSFTGGLNPRVKNDTATGAEILDANAEEVFQPILATKADTRLKNGRNAFELWCRNTPVKQPIPLKDRKGSGKHVLEISGEEVEGEYEWQILPGSELPKNRLSKRRDMVTFYGQFGGAPTYFELKKSGQFDQEIAEVERAFDMDFASEGYDDIGELCRRRFEMAKDLLAQASGIRDGIHAQYGINLPAPNPIFVLPEVMPSMLVTEGEHQKKIEWFSRLLDTPEGQEMSPEDRTLVSAFITGHMALAEGQAIEITAAMARVQVAGNAPIQENQIAVQNAEGDANAQREGQAKQQDAEIAAQGQPDADGDAARQLAVGEVEHERAKEMAGIEHENNMQLERTRLKAQRKAEAAT